MSHVNYKRWMSALAAVLGIGLCASLSGCALADPGDEAANTALADVSTDMSVSPLGGVKRIDLHASVLPANEVPSLPAGNPEATISGTGVLRLQLKDGGGAVAGLIFDLCGLPGTSITFTKADVRKGGPGETSPVPLIFGTVTPDMPATFTFTNGCLKEGFGGLAAPGESLAYAAKQVIQEPTAYYIELSTTTNPNGAVRGQLDYPTAP